MGDRWKESHLGRRISPDDIFKRCPPKSEFDNSACRVRGDRPRKRWVPEVAINNDDRSAVACD